MATINPLIPVDTGAIEVWAEVWRSDRMGVLQENITDYLISGMIDYDRDRTIKMGARFAFSHAHILQEFVDFIAPFLYVRYPDGTVASGQLGLFGFEIPEKEIWPENVPLYIEGMDLSWILALAATRSSYTIKRNTRITTSLQDLFESCGIFYYDIPTGTDRWPRTTTFPLGTNKLAIAQAITSSIGWSDVHPNMSGRLTAGPITLVQDMNPFITCFRENFISPPRLRPVQSAMPNVVIVKKDNPTGAPLKVVRVNADASSPSSTVNTGVEVAYIVDNPDFQSITEMKLYAAMLIERFKSVEYTLEIELPPIPDLEGLDAVEIICGVDDARIAGKYGVRGWSVGLDEQSATLKLVLSKVQRLVTEWTEH